MTPRSAPTKHLLAEIAEARATGQTWESIAKKHHRRADTIRQWPRRYAAAWESCLHAAEVRLVAEATAEAIHTLRQQLRSADEKSAREAAKQLLALRLAFKKQQTTLATPGGDAALTKFLAECRREELDALRAESALEAGDLGLAA